ncbi:FAD-dependent oxidoreductase [Croceiramulus getboli]|nr:NAD(P)/FAD-dependent oxidoreductase [Flavobacteriaceae bacterium YJPT1-3]
MLKKDHILIIGAGLCGSLLALRMAQRGYRITLMEKRPDMRAVHQDAGRSINLAFSARGMKGIKLVGLEKEVTKLCIPMLGRMIHDPQGNTLFSPYSGRQDEYINSISRTDLNIMLLNALEAFDNVDLRFNQSCKKVDLEAAGAAFEDYNTKEQVTIQADVILGADGAGSAVRKSMFNHKKFLFSYAQDYLTHGYKELTIPPTADGGYRTEKGALHIWPRGEDMLIALPNLDGSFTVTLFLPYSDSDYCFDNLNSAERVNDYFAKEFPDALALMPDLATEFFENPTGPLGTIKCSPWHAYGKVCLLGDAAHAIVPFYGQGMNASFEDVVVFDGILEEYEGDWDQVFGHYQKARKKDTDAIADLAVDNFHEMKEHTASPLFQAKRKLETAFEKEFPADYYSKYSLVTFKGDLPYAEAMRRGRAQDKAILNLLDEGALPDSLSRKQQLDKVLAETEAILNEDALINNLK